MDEKTNGAAPAAQEQLTVPPAPELDVDDINGRLSELSDINAQLTARCAMMRGQIAMKDKQIAKLTQENIGFRQREDEAAQKTVLANKKNGGKEKTDG